MDNQNVNGVNTPTQENPQFSPRYALVAEGAKENSEALYMQAINGLKVIVDRLKGSSEGDLQLNEALLEELAVLTLHDHHTGKAYKVSGSAVTEGAKRLRRLVELMNKGNDYHTRTKNNQHVLVGMLAAKHTRCVTTGLTAAMTNFFNNNCYMQLKLSDGSTVMLNFNIFTQAAAKLRADFMHKVTEQYDRTAGGYTDLAVYESDNPYYKKLDDKVAARLAEQATEGMSFDFTPEQYYDAYCEIETEMQYAVEKANELREEHRCVEKKENGCNAGNGEVNE